MLGRIPTARRQVQAADESNRIVHHNNLLMMGCTGWVPVIQVEMQPRVTCPFFLEERQPLAICGHEHGEIPIQHMNMQLGVALEHAVEEFAQLDRKAVGLVLPHQFDATIDIPRHNQNGTLRLLDHLPKSTEIRGPIHQKRDAVGVLDAPAVSARLEDREWRRRGFLRELRRFLCQCRFSGKTVPSYIRTVE